MEFLIAYFWYFLAGFLGFFVWRRRKQKPLSSTSAVLIIGHRGAAGYALQNSLPSVKKAVELGVDLIEVDVRRTWDGVFVLSHDDRVLGRKNRKCKISRQPFSVLRNLVLPGKNRLATLSEFIEEVPVTQKICLDLKVNGSEFEFLSFLRKHDLVERTIVTSHFAQSLRLLKVLEPDLVVGLSFPKDRFSFWEKIFLIPVLAPVLILIKHTYPFYLGFLCSWAQADFVSVYFRLLTGRLVKVAHKRGLLVFPFLVNRRKDILRMLRFGVDGINSDYPDRASAILANLSGKRNLSTDRAILREV